MMWGFGLFGIYFFTSLYLQDVLRFSATRAGLAFVPMALLMAAGATVSDRVAARIGAHRSVGIAMALMAAGIVSVSLLGRHASFADLMPGFAVIGAVLTARQSAQIRLGHSSVAAFLSGYRLGLICAAALVAAGGVVAWVALRQVDPT